MIVKVNNIDVSNDVIKNSFNYIERIDTLYGTGSIKLESATLTQNIPPYSVIEINGKQYCGSSQATLHYGKQTWFHDVELIELTSLLSRILIGSKAFSTVGSNQLDAYKLEILFDLGQEYSGYTFNITQDLMSIFNKNIEYTFGAGTTLFDAVEEICKQYNYKVIVKSISNNVVNVEFMNLSGKQTQYLDSTRILSHKKLQNPETYCKYLESEAKNVIDRNQLIKVDNLTLTSQSVKLSQDTMILELPTRAEEVVDFGVANTDATMSVNINFTQSKFPFSTTSTITYQQATQYYPILDTLWNDIFSKYFVNKTTFYNTTWNCYSNVMTPNITNQYSGQIPNAVIKEYSFKNNLLSKEKWELLEANQKPKYAYYTSNTNVIDGLNTYYKTDLWNTIIGSSVSSFFVNIGVPRDETYANYSFNGGKFTSFSVFGTQVSAYYNNPFNNRYYAKYYPISNPYIKDDKVSTPTNESEFKKFGVSYGKSSNFVDFDKLITAMKIENSSLGYEEEIIEYDITGLTNYPTIADPVVFSGGIGRTYISNAQFNYSGDRIIATYNLVNNYNKIADCIALDSQYKQTRVPTDNIIERPIFVERDATNITLDAGNCYFRIMFYAENPTASQSNYIYIHKPAVLMQQDDVVYAYCEMNDYFSAGKYVEVVDSSNNVFKLVDAHYCDYNNEVVYAIISLIEFNAPLSLEKARKLPFYNASNYTLKINAPQKKIYKDTREKLTFTFKLKNCIIK